MTGIPKCPPDTDPTPSLPCHLIRQKAMVGGARGLQGAELPRAPLDLHSEEAQWKGKCFRSHLFLCKPERQRFKTRADYLSAKSSSGTSDETRRSYCAKKVRSR